MKLKLHRAVVTDHRILTPGMVRLRFGGEGLADFRSTGVADEYVRLFFPDIGTGELVLPEIDEKGHWHYPEGKRPSHCEPYTIRKLDAAAGTFDIDFVVHEGGRASAWAQDARPGDAILLNDPHAISEIPPDLKWILYACDATGLPALGRLIEALPANTKARAVIEIAELEHVLELHAIPDLEITWFHGTGNGVGPSVLAEAVKRIDLPAAGGFVWVAGEQRAVRPIRKYLRQDLKLPASRYSVTGYWTDRLAEWEQGWENLDALVKGRIEAAWESDRDREEVADEVEAALEANGL